MFDEDGWAECWAVVGSGAAVSMSACSDFEVEGTIHFVLFCSMDSSQALCHCYFLVVNCGWVGACLVSTTANSTV